MQFCQLAISYAQVVVSTPTALSAIPIESWKVRRDKGVVKQHFDYSCGAASLATLMRFYGKEVTEKQIMEAMNKQDNIASFEDMAKVLPQFGFVAQGFALSFEQLTQLKIPAVAYLKPERDDHFTVIRGVSNFHIRVGDPSWGNRTLTKARFLEMWQTRDDELLKGKILVVQPIQAEPLIKEFFSPPEPITLPETVLIQRML